MTTCEHRSGFLGEHRVSADDDDVASDSGRPGGHGVGRRGVAGGCVQRR